MQEKYIIELWRSGLSKEQIAKQYKRQYNQQIKVIRSELRNRHSGKFITSYEALAYIERVIYEYLKRRRIKMTEKETDEYINKLEQDRMKILAEIIYLRENNQDKR